MLAGIARGITASAILSPPANRSFTSSIFDFIHHVVITDRCALCHGVWLDEYELSLILKYMKQEDIAIAEIAKEEVKKVKKESEKKFRSEVVSENKAVDRKTFFKILFGT